MSIRSILFPIICGLFLSCNSTSDNSTHQADTDIQAATVENPVMEVSISEARQGEFRTTIQADGHLRANGIMELVWNASGYVTQVEVTEGESIHEGDILARLGTDQLDKELEQARINLETARLRREDMLISGRLDSSDLAEDKLRNINLLSGFTQAQYDVNGIQSQMEEQLIRAPHSGVIYDIRQMEGAAVSPGTVFGSLIDNQSFRVEFEILESELGKVRTGQPLEVHPLAGQFSPFRSTIHRIIPIVNPQGLVTILAKATGNTGTYYDGMKVRVLVERTITDQIIVPRDALVIRSGRQVVFTYDSASSLAKWQYVSTGLENETSVTITEGINPGDLVITDGNLNLSHDAEVMVDHPEQ